MITMIKIKVDRYLSTWTTLTILNLKQWLTSLKGRGIGKNQCGCCGVITVVIVTVNNQVIKK